MAFAGLAIAQFTTGSTLGNISVEVCSNCHPLYTGQQKFLTVQNEAQATQVWESNIFSADEERDFVKNYLGPALRSAGPASYNVR